jgi:hypothetical protein
MAASGVTNPSNFGTGGMPEALNLAISNNVCYWEIWNNDITDGSFDSLLSNATCSALNLEENTKIEDNLTIYPNPSNNFFTISMDINNIQKIEVINELGQTIFRKENINNSQYSLDIGNSIDGIFFLKVTDDKKRVSYRKIILKK